MIYVLFPAFNEEAVIRPTLLALWQAMRGETRRYQAVLIDDGSTDGTVVEARQAVAESDGELPLEVLRHGENRGLGAGLRTGISWCLERASDDDVIVTLDADNTHPPKLIPGMVDKIGEGLDLVIASRYQRGARVIGVPAYRNALSAVGRLMFQAAFPMRGVRDYTCCFRAYRAPVLRRAQIVYGDDFLTARGFEAVMDLLLRLRQLGIQAGEVPLELHYEQRVGSSKMNVTRTIRRTLALLAKRWWEGKTRYSRGHVRERLREVEGARLRASS